MKPTIRLFALIFGLLLMTACSPVRPLAGTPAPAAAEPAAGTDADTNADTAATGASLPDAVLAALASELGVQPDALTIVSAEAVEWPDACLGVAEPGQMCAQVITPGYRIVVEVGGEQRTYHTDRGALSIRLAPDTPAQIDKGMAELSFARLAYAGPEDMGSGDDSRCAQMEITGSEVQLVACDGTETALPLSASLAAAWDDWRARLGSFTYETPTEQVTFAGQGESVGEEWQRALLAWTRLTRAELATGQTSASARTALSWNLGLLADTPDVCAHLTVLDYGYAYAEQRACEGGDLVTSAEGWLEQAEMEQFDAWLYGYAPLYVDDNYLNGVGATDMAADEAAAVAAWAQALWTRLAGLPLAPAEADGTAAGADGTAVTCSAPDGGDVFESVEYGFCLVTPPDYAMVETAPGSFSLVAGGDIMNHTNPRVGIEVTEAGDRTLAQVAAELATNYAAPGDTVEPQPASVGGVEGMLFDNLPGQDINRRLVAVHNGRVYSLQLMPLSPAAEPFYQAVLDSLRIVSEP
jgi:hypothetical protein